jgi:hypothetical protein
MKVWVSKSIFMTRTFYKRFGDYDSNFEWPYSAGRIGCPAAVQATPIVQQSSYSGDVAVSKHIQLGAGYRYSKLRSNEDEKISIIAPFSRITLGRSAKEDLNP